MLIVPTPCRGVRPGLLTAASPRCKVEAKGRQQVRSRFVPSTGELGGIPGYKGVQMWSSLHQRSYSSALLQGKIIERVALAEDWGG